LVDATNDEQDTSSNIIMFAINKQKDCCNVHVLKNGAFSFDDWPKMMETAVGTTETLFHQLSIFVNSAAFVTEDELLAADIPPVRKGLLV
jgi:exosome complex RNA-binding protein Rrp42 (RNase PH superfamily)